MPDFARISLDLNESAWNCDARKKLSDLVLTEHTFEAVKLSLAAVLESDVFAWMSIPPKLVRWSWISRGYCTVQDIQKWLGWEDGQVQEELKACGGMLKDAIHLQKVPELPASTVSWIVDPQPGETELMILVETSKGKWDALPQWMRPTLTSKIEKWSGELNSAFKKLAFQDEAYEKKLDASTAKAGKATKSPTKTKMHLKAQATYDAVLGENPCTMVYDMQNQCLVDNPLSKGPEFLSRCCTALQVKMDTPYKAECLYFKTAWGSRRSGMDANF